MHPWSWNRRYGSRLRWLINMERCRMYTDTVRDGMAGEMACSREKCLSTLLIPVTFNLQDLFDPPVVQR